MTAIIHDVFDSLPEQIKRIPPPRVVMSPEVAGSAYAFGQIYLSPGQRQGAWFDTHLVHEYAHHVAVKTGVCKTPEFKAAMLDCIERAKGLSVDDIETQTKTTNDAISHEIAYMFLIALEGEEWGSVKDYFKNRPGIHEEEVFAVALQAYMHYSNRFWKMFPKMKEFFDERYGDNEKSITLPWLTKKLGDIRGDSIKQSRGGVRAHWHDYAKKANIDPDELHTIAAEYKHHHDEAAGEKHNMLKRAREFSVKNGFGNISQLRRMNANGKIDSSMLRGFDEIAEDAANNYPHFFKDDSAGEGSNLDQLFEMLTNDAKPEEMDWEEAYKFAANHIDSKPEREPGSDEDVSDAEEFGLGSDSNDFDFGANKQRDINPDEFKEIPKDQKQRGAFGDDEPSKEADPHADAKKLESKLAKKNPNGFTGIKRNQGFIHGTKVDSDTYDRHRALEKSREPTPEPAQAPAPAPAQPQQAAPMPANQPSNPSAASKPKDPGAQTNFTGVSFGNYFINGQKVDEATYHAYAEQKKQQAKNQNQAGKPTDRTNPDLDAFFGATPAQKPAGATAKESRPNTDLEDFFNGTKSKPQAAPSPQVKPTGNLPHQKTQANVLNAANEYARNAKNPDHDARAAAFKKARSALKDHHAAGIAHLDSLQTGGNRRQIAKAKKAFTDRMWAIESKLGALGGFQARVKTQTPAPVLPVKQNQAAGQPKPAEPPPINPQYGRSRDQHKLTQQHLHERQRQSMRDLQDKHDQQLEALQRRLSGRGGPRLNMRGGLLGLAAGMMAGDNRAKNRRLIEQLKDKQAHIEAKLAKRHKVQRQQMANRHKLRISQIPTTKKGLMEWLTPSVEPIAAVGRLPWMDSVHRDEPRTKTKALHLPWLTKNAAFEALHPRANDGEFANKDNVEPKVAKIGVLQFRERISDLRSAMHEAIHAEEKRRDYLRLQVIQAAGELASVYPKRPEKYDIDRANQALEEAKNFGWYGSPIEGATKKKWETGFDEYLGEHYPEIEDVRKSQGTTLAKAPEIVARAMQEHKELVLAAKERGENVPDDILEFHGVSESSYSFKSNENTGDARPFVVMSKAATLFVNGLPYGLKASDSNDAGMVKYISRDNPQEMDFNFDTHGDARLVKRYTDRVKKIAKATGYEVGEPVVRVVQGNIFDRQLVITIKRKEAEPNAG